MIQNQYFLLQFGVENIQLIQHAIFIFKNNVKGKGSINYSDPSVLKNIY